MDRATKTQRILEGLARWLVTAAIVLAPWLFGSTDPWAFLFISGLVGTGATVWLFSLVCASQPRLRLPGLTLVLVLLLGYTAFQSLPLPLPFVQSTNRAAAAITDPARTVLASVAAVAAPTPAPTPQIISSALSFSPLATRSSLGLMLASFLAFLVMLNTIRGWTDASRAAGVIVVSAFLMAVLAMVHKFSGSQEILWFHTPRFGGNVFGPFTNRNHFAAYMNMALGLVVGLFLAARPLGQAGGGMDWRERLAYFSSRQASRALMIAFAVVIMGASVCVSLSRGAILSLALTLGAMCALIGRGSPALARARTTLLIVAGAMLLLILSLGIREIAERIGTLRDVAANPLADLRTVVTRDSLKIFTSAPLLGTGFGTFRHVYSMYQTPPLASRWLHAHNDWVQLFVEGGLIGAGLFCTAILLGLVAWRRRFRDVADTPRLMLLGLGLSLGTITIHSLFDYGLHKPANTLMLAFCAALALATAHLRRSGSTPPPVRNPPPAVLRVLALAALAGLVVLLPHGLRELRGQLAFSRFLYLQRLTDKVSGPEDLERSVTSASSEASLVIAFARYDADALAEITFTLLDWSTLGELPRPVRAQLSQQASDLAFWSACAAPSDYLPWTSLARAQMSLGNWDEADACLQRARELVRHPAEVKMFNVVRHPTGDGEQQIP